MPKLTYSHNNLPSPESFRKQLAEAMAQSNPLDDLLELSLELREIENKRGMTSKDFYEQYQQGKMGDDEESVQWAIRYRAYLELKKRVELALMRQAVWGEHPIT